MGRQIKETVQGTYTFEKVVPIEAEMRGAIPSITPPSNFNDGGPKIGLKRWKKVGYKFNPFTDEVEQPQLILVNRRLKKICEIINFSNFRLTLKELNQANEISFTVYKELNGVEQPAYDRIADLGVVYVNGEFFEIGITNQEDAAIKKNVVGVSLGYAELSQIITSVQINTDDDLIRKDLDKYRERFDCGTIFYNPVQIGDTEEVAEWRNLTSMLERIMSQAPHYQIGTVDETLRNVKRTFSWEDTDIVSILNSIGEEVGCVFDIVVEYDTNGNAVRKVNAYDLCYCKYCWNQVRGLNEEFETSGDTYRNIENGVCLNCKDTVDINDGHTRTGGEDIVDIGFNTGIFLSTENLADDITIDGNKDGIKTSFKIVGGDDFMTDTLQGLNPSGVNRIMLFPPYMMKNFSPDLYDNYTKYRQVLSTAEKPYEDLVKIEYNLRDIWLYLKDGRMPVFDEPIVDVETAFLEIARKIGNEFYNNYYIDSKINESEYAIKSAVSKMIKTFAPRGFAVKVETTSVNKIGHDFYGTIKLYSTSKKDECITLEKDTSGVRILKGENNQPYSGEHAGELESFIRNIRFKFGDPDSSDFKGYIESCCASLLSKNDLEYTNEKEKDWSQYSYERLKNWYDGYAACLDTLHSMYKSAETNFAQNTVNDMITMYANIQKCIEVQMNIVKNQLYAIGTFLGEYDSMFLDSNNQLIPYTYFSDQETYFNNGNKFGTDKETINTLDDVDRGDKVVSNLEFTPCCNIGNYPFKCKKCGSSNVRRLVDDKVHCRNCGNIDESKMITYRTMTQEVIDFYNDFNNYISSLGIELGTVIGDISGVKNELIANGISIMGIKKSVQKLLNIHNYLDKSLYDELMSFVREQVYQNQNYISEGLTNEELIQQALELQAKAKRELSKACMPQYSITTTVGSIVALEPYEYMGDTYNVDLANFAINNYIHVRFDDDIYKMRVSSIELSYPMSDKITVSFTNAERYINGYSSDVASILANAQSMATSFDAVANQSEKGMEANNLFDKIKQQGLDTSLMAVNGGRNQQVLIDDHGILLRELNEYTDKYDPHQTKMISNNIVMTDDNWSSAKLAIGLTLNPAWTEAKILGDSECIRRNIPTVSQIEGSGTKYLYGVYADAIVADLVVSKHMRRIGNGNGDDCTVDIDANGINIAKGYLDIHDGKGNRAIINPCGIVPSSTRIGDSVVKEVSPNYIFYASSSKPPEGYSESEFAKNAAGAYDVFHIDIDGNAYFAGEIQARKGHIANWKIETDCIHTDNNSASFVSVKNQASYQGAYFGKYGLRIGNNFSVDEYGNVCGNDVYFTNGYFSGNGEFTGYIKANSGWIGNCEITEDGDIFAANAYLKGKIKATEGFIGAFEINDGAIIGGLNRTGNVAKIHTEGHSSFANPDPTSGEGYYIGPEGLCIGNFYIQTGGSTKGIMAMPKLRVVPFKNDYGDVPGYIQFIGSKKAQGHEIYSPDNWEEGVGWGDDLYITYTFLGDPNAKKGIGKAAYNCLEIRNSLDNKSGFSSEEIGKLGKLRCYDVIVGNKSLKEILIGLGYKGGWEK